MAGPANGQSMPSDRPQVTGWRQTFGSLHGNRDFSVLFAGNIMFFFGMITMIVLRSGLVIQK